jgi:hypothetical protein
MVYRFFNSAVIFIFLALMLGVSSARSVPPKPGAAQGQQQENGSPVLSLAAVIENSGSTNTSGWRLTVYRSGSAEWTVSQRRNSPLCGKNKGTLSPELTRRFFRDLSSLMPLSKLPAGHCAKSASFGTAMRATFQGATSPDLTCPAGGETDQLLKDVGEIETALGIATQVGAPSGCEQTAPERRHQLPSAK